MVIFHCALEQRDLYFGIYRLIQRAISLTTAGLRAFPTGICSSDC
jgi:hypothetical protein